MTQPIYKVYTGNMSEAWYRLSKEEQDSLLANVAEALDKVGGEIVVLCNSLWSGDGVMFFGVEKFPDIEAVQKHTELLSELNWLRYVNSKSILGTEWSN